MKGGDISNDPAPAMGIRFERVIKTSEGKLNRTAKAFIETLGRLECNIHIITTEDPRRCMAFLVKWRVPFTRVIGADSTLEIPDICREQHLLTYYDLDKDILQNVNSRGAGDIEVKLFDQVEVA